MLLGREKIALLKRIAKSDYNAMFGGNIMHNYEYKVIILSTYTACFLPEECLLF